MTKPQLPAGQIIKSLDDLPAEYHCKMHTVRPGQTFTGRSGAEYRVGHDKVVKPNPTNPKDLAFFIDASSADIISGPAPDPKDYQPQSNDALNAEIKTLAAQLEEAKSALKRREEEIRDLRNELAKTQTDLKAALAADAARKGGK